MKNDLPELTDADKARYEWQLWVAGFGEEGQRRLKSASVLVTRVGGVGGNVALQLAAAGVGRLLLVHAGAPRVSDYQRQILMSEGEGGARVEQAKRRLQIVNPLIEIDTLAENVSPGNVDQLVRPVDVIACCAPLFEERLLLNEAAFRWNKPLINCAMYDLEMQLTTILPGRTGCLACWTPEPPPEWKRRFPVFGAVAGVVGCLGAVEVIKVIAGLGEPLANQMLLGDLRTMHFHKVRVARNPDCDVCGEQAP